MPLFRDIRWNELFPVSTEQIGYMDDYFLRGGNFPDAFPYLWIPEKSLKTEWYETVLLDAGPAGFFRCSAYLVCK